ncbi:MAG TPA: hypothetical protein VGK74_10265 [Symbiobacteriaceae bacterium]|jgi:hypothetical protein
MPASAKIGTAWLSASTGLARTTVLAGLAQLTAQGWYPPPPGAGATVPIPEAVLTNRRLSTQARVLYGLLLLTPGFLDPPFLSHSGTSIRRTGGFPDPPFLSHSGTSIRRTGGSHPGGRFSYAELADLAHASRNTVAKALAELVRAEWVTLDRAHRRAPIHFELTFPGRERGEIALAAAQRRLSKKDNPFGEALMREYLSLLVDSDAFEDNASPGFLLNPRTQELLQFDRYYPPNVAFEFNGPQHYRATDRFTPGQVATQRERDYIKMGICMERGITLLIIHPEDLTVAVMQQKVADRLPLRNLTGHDLLIEHLESESRTYRRRMEGI